jgi:hypothetical protein
MANLQVNGWGPFRIPGEKARLQRLENSVDQLLAASSKTPAQEHRADSSLYRTAEERQQSRPPSTGREGSVEASAGRWERLGERKIFFEGQEGADVAQLQKQLWNFGFLPKASISGRFDDVTENALRDFQHRFGIYVDGVAGSVTAKVLRFLGTIHYQPDQIPVPDDVLVLIQRVARSQRLGIALIGKADTIQREDVERADVRLEIINSVSRELVSLLNDHPILQGAELPEGYTPERAAQLADSIDAELVIYLDVLNDSDIGPGIATYFFSTATSDSAIGAPLAKCIHDELKRVAGVSDRGCTGEDSRLLQQPNAPTVRVELGNLNNQSDRARLEDQGHIHRLAKAMMLGISRLYELELPETTATTVR